MKMKKQNSVYGVDLLIWGNIRRYQYLNRLSDEQLAQSLGISTRTLYSYDKKSVHIDIRADSMLFE